MPPPPIRPPQIWNQQPQIPGTDYNTDLPAPPVPPAFVPPPPPGTTVS